ncbi:hypothetical protein BZV88_21085, partial [Salmonella enterica subsp. enterica serovar Newport]|nr:hypothetical protein [Salmonella enterica subsp. enterica serovar Newport]
AHGPVSLDRLHQIREILSKAAAQSDGGNLGYAMADAVKVIDEVLNVPEKLPCPVHLEPGLKFGKGVPTSLVLGALRRRADYYAELEAMTPEQRAEHDAGISEFKAMLGGGFRDLSQPVDPQIAEYEKVMLQAGNSPVTPGCSCRTCRPVTMNDMRFVVCPECGNKRCPHANNHRNDCTGSNDPGQIGSAYPASPQQEVKP